MKAHTTTINHGAILFMGKYGATRQYAQWIAEATGLPVFDLDERQPDICDYDFFILGSSVYIGKLYLGHWLHANWPVLKNKPVLLFSVSGSPPEHPDLEATLSESLTSEMRRIMAYVPLRGRLDLKQLPWFLRLMLPLVGRMQKDPETRERMMHGFDKMDRSKIEPILQWTKETEGVYV